MRNSLCFRLFLASIFIFSGIALSQTGPPAAAPSTAPSVKASATPATPGATLSGSSGSSQLIERIQVEGASTRIDEVRVGGETRSITVQPKGGLPAYEVQPATGARAWKIFGF